MERLLYLGVHCGADRVLTFVRGSRSAVNHEMLSNHLRIIVPHLKIGYRCSLLSCKSESGCALIDWNFIEDLEFDVCDTLLSRKNTNDKAFDDIEGRLRVCMRLDTC